MSNGKKKRRVGPGDWVLREWDAFELRVKRTQEQLDHCVPKRKVLQNLRRKFAHEVVRYVALKRERTLFRVGRLA